MESGNFVLDLHSSISRVVYLNTEPSGTYLVFDSHIELHAHNSCLVLPCLGYLDGEVAADGSIFSLVLKRVFKFDMWYLWDWKYSKLLMVWSVRIWIPIVVCIFIVCGVVLLFVVMGWGLWLMLWRKWIQMILELFGLECRVECHILDSIK